MDNCKVRTDRQAVIKCTSKLLFPLLGFFIIVVFSSCSKTYSLHAYLNVRSCGERGQVWLSVRCGDGEKPSLSSWLIPIGATVHSHCEMGLTAQIRVEGVRGADAIGLREQAISFRIFVQMGLEHTYSLW